MFFLFLSGKIINKKKCFKIREWHLNDLITKQMEYFITELEEKEKQYRLTLTEYSAISYTVGGPIWAS